MNSENRGNGPRIDVDWAFDRYEAVRHRLPPLQVEAASPTYAGTLSDIADEYDVFVLDGFGVLNIGSRAVPGAVDRMAQLRGLGKRVIVLTNAATLPPGAAVDKYRAMGFDFAPTEVVSSRDVAASALSKMSPALRWGVAGAGPASLVGLAPHTHELLDKAEAYDTADAFLLVSGDSWGPRQQQMLHESLAARERAVIVANPDVVAPREAGLTLEPGEWAHRLADALSLAPEFYGKPFPNAFDAVLDRLGADAPARERIAMVGDTLHTDILGGAAARFGTVLVARHGLFAGREVEPYIERCGIVPDFIVETT